MRVFLIAVVALVAACGEVVPNKFAQGEACTDSASCMTGSCVDGVCCDRACNSTCEACVSAKTGGTDGTCAAVTSGSDPDSECADTGAATCGARGTGCNGDATAPGCQVYAAGTSCGSPSCSAGSASNPTCNGTGTCTTAPASCGYFGCDGPGVACRTTCSTSVDCSATGFCNASGICAKRLRIAMETGATSCVRTESFVPLKAALEARGHTVTIVTGDLIDTATELAGYDVVLLGGPGAACTQPGYATYATALKAWVEAGGGFVATGWTPYMTSGGANQLPVDVAAIMPTSGSAYLTGAQTVTAVGTHPIVNGLGTFTVQAAYLPYGGTAKPGTTQLLRDGSNNNLGQAWDVSQGRVVFLGPLYVDSFASYANQSLTDGTNVPAREMLMRAIEWTGKSL